MFFEYGSMQTNYLKQRDPRLGTAIDRIGFIQRAVDDNLFTSVLRHIIGQQISTAAQATIWQRLIDRVGIVCPGKVNTLALDELQQLGMTFRKANYILAFSAKVQSGDFPLEHLATQPDAQVIQALTAINGIGVWTAEMILLFGMQRSDILSYGDLAILRGMRLLYGLPAINVVTFKQYAQVYSPYGSVASLYLWAIAKGAISALTQDNQET